jgi:hypothetical protein
MSALELQMLAHKATLTPEQIKQNEILSQTKETRPI